MLWGSQGGRVSPLVYFNYGGVYTRPRSGYVYLKMFELKTGFSETSQRSRS